MKTYRIAAIPGDGIGKEVLPEGVRTLDAVAAKFGFAIDWQWKYLGQLRLVPEAWPDDAGRLVRAARRRWTRSISARSAGRPRCPTTSRCGARCSSSAAASINASTCARPGSCRACLAPRREKDPGDIDMLDRAREHRG